MVTQCEEGEGNKICRAGACGRELEFLTFPLEDKRFRNVFVPKRHNVPFAPVLHSLNRECLETLIPVQRPPPDIFYYPPPPASLPITFPTKLQLTKPQVYIIITYVIKTWSIYISEEGRYGKKRNYYQNGYSECSF